MHAYLDHPGPLALAHRGFSRSGLENTMVAFQAAVDLGFRYVETDVHATADGVAVAFHDASLARVTDATGLIADLPWDRVRRARVGGTEQVATLAEVLHTWPDLRLNIDVKSATAIAPTVEAIERAGAHHRVLVGSFSDARRRAALRALSRPVATSAGTRTVAAFVLGSRLGAGAVAARAVRRVDCLQVPRRHGRLEVVTPATVARAHALTTQVHVWTVNEPAEMHRLLDLGVDGIVTDRADLLRAVLVERGQWVA